MKSKLGIFMLLLCGLSFLLYERKDTKKNDLQKEKIILGTIVDEINNEPINEVSIAKQGENPSSVSNAEGEFAILASEENELVFRHDNYKTKVVVGKDARQVKMELRNPQK